MWVLENPPRRNAGPEIKGKPGWENGKIPVPSAAADIRPRYVGLLTYHISQECMASTPNSDIRVTGQGIIQPSKRGLDSLLPG